MASSSNKTMYTHVFPREFLVKPWDIIFVANIFLTYFLRATLELPLLEIPLKMMLYNRTLSNIFIKEVEGLEWRCGLY